MDSKYSLIEESSQRVNGNGILNGFATKRKLSNTNGNHKSPKKSKNNVHLKDTGKTKHVNGEISETHPPITQSIQQQRENLPAYACRHRLLQEIRKNDTILIMGETGSGKTTQMPQFLHEAGYSNKGMIAITQPRRVAAITVAKRVSQEMGCKLGETVGFTVRFEDCTSKQTKIRFVTDGSLLREALSDRLLRSYSVIILDEVHERTVNTDVLFGIVRNAQKQRKLFNMEPLKIVVTSATMDIDHFGKYFGVKGMYLEGRVYPVKVMHVKQPQSDYLHACLVTIFDIHRNAPPNHDILVFLTGQEEIDAMAQQARLIAKTNDLNSPNLRVFSLYSQMPQNKQLECFIPSAPNSRKVILATNIAETSITIPGIRYVIDSGFVKRRVYDPTTGMESLKVVRISQAQSWQRCGRAGREAEGYCYRTYTKDEMESFDLMPVPEILRSNITSTALQLLALGIDCRTFDFLDKPSPKSTEAGYKELHLLGAIKSVDAPELTALGRRMALFPLDPRYSKLLLTAPEYGCLEEMLSIVAVISGENIFVTMTEKREQAALAHAKFESKYGDHLTLLNVYRAFQKTDKIKLWCHDNFLNTRNLLYAKDVRNQLKEICDKCHIPESTCGNNLDKVRKCLIAGLFNNIAELQRDSFYMAISIRQRARIHPSSVLCGKSKPTYVIYSEIVSTERNFMRVVTAIEPEWIGRVVPQYPYLNRIQCTNNS